MRLMGRLLWIVTSVAMVVLAIDFAASNDGIIILSLWPFTDQLDVPIWLFGVTAFVTGGLLGAVLMWGQALAIRARLWQAQSQNRKLQAQIAQQSETGDDKTVPRLPGQPL